MTKDFFEPAVVHFFVLDSSIFKQEQEVVQRLAYLLSNRLSALNKYFSATLLRRYKCNWICRGPATFFQTNNGVFGFSCYHILNEEHCFVITIPVLNMARHMSLNIHGHAIGFHVGGKMQVWIFYKKKRNACYTYDHVTSFFFKVTELMTMSRAKPNRKRYALCQKALLLYTMEYKNRK